MSRLQTLKRLALAGLAAGAIVVACRSAQPGESPPLGPRPEPSPVSDPVPGAPEPLDPIAPGSADGGTSLPPTSAAPQDAQAPGAPVSKVSVTAADPPVFHAQATGDAGVDDAGAGDAGDAQAAAAGDAGDAGAAMTDGGAGDGGTDELGMDDAGAGDAGADNGVSISP